MSTTPKTDPTDPVPETDPIDESLPLRDTQRESVCTGTVSNMRLFANDKWTTFSSDFMKGKRNFFSLLPNERDAVLIYTNGNAIPKHRCTKEHGVFKIITMDGIVKSKAFSMPCLGVFIDGKCTGIFCNGY